MSVRFAILGAGRIGQVHARAVASVPGATLVAIAEPQPAAAAAAPATFGCEIRSIAACVAAMPREYRTRCLSHGTGRDLHAGRGE